MLFRQLEYFVAVAQERHFARAAEKCYVSQPALSSAIAKLERELNVTLINRGHSFEGLTREGERLVVWAKRILAEHAAFKAEVDAVRSGITDASARHGSHRVNDGIPGAVGVLLGAPVGEGASLFPAGCDRAVPTAARIRARCRHRAPRDPRQ